MDGRLRLGGAAAICAALLLVACSKAEQSSTTTTSSGGAAAVATDMPIAGESPGAEATTTASTSESSMSAPTAGMTSNTTTATTTAGSNGAGSGAYIDLPLYPGATESKDQQLSMSSNGVSMTVKVYTTKDDAKRVAEWYKEHLPASFKGGVLTSGENTVATFSQEHTGADAGDQSVIVGSQSDKSTRIQLTTKHGK